MLYDDTLIVMLKYIYKVNIHRCTPPLCDGVLCGIVSAFLFAVLPPYG